MELEQAKEKIERAIHRKHLLCIVGSCYVEYKGRAASKLPRGKRMLMIKGDNSFAVHQNRLLRPVNYMMNARIASSLSDGNIVLSARKQNPREEIKAIFYSVDAIHSHEMDEDADLRLFGSERELADELIEDLSFIEPGLRACNTEEVFRKGVVDIMAEDADENMVVIEVKRRKADFKAVTQLQRYMKQVEKIKGKKTRGILLAPEIGKNALELLENYGLEFARFEFEIGNPSSTIKGVHKKQSTIGSFI